jgi:peptidyl-prolyl cis-trans isomerase D
MIEKSSYESTQLALERIKEVEELLNAGNNFSELAGIYSEDIITKDIGGDLDYFEKDIFPVEFDLGIKDLKLNEISEIIELEDTFHILKVTEINIQEPLPENQIKDELANELIETESLALMMDDFNATEEMIFDNSSIEDIADKLSKEVLISEFYTSNNYNFDISSQEVKEFLFSIDSQVNESIVIELDEKVIVMSISTIIEPSLQPYEIVAETVADLLSESKSLEKLALMENELKSIEDPDDKQVFIDAYNYVSSDVFIDVKRNSSLLPSEVLNEVFKNIPGTVINVDANNGDKYIVEINNFTNPSESDITAILDQYRSYSEERMSFKMSEIIDEDAFESARVNLTNLAF